MAKSLLKDRRTICFQCCRPQCTSTVCQTCTVCRDPACKDRNCTKPIQVPNSQQLPRTLKEVETFLCIHCRVICGVCKEALGQDEYAESMWHNRFSTQRTLCLRCCRPPCISPQCKTCKVCRDPECKRRKCDDAVKPLNPKQLPSTLDEVKAYLCKDCRAAHVDVEIECPKQCRRKGKNVLARRSTSASIARTRTCGMQTIKLGDKLESLRARLSDSQVRRKAGEFTSSAQESAQGFRVYELGSGL